MKPQNVTIERLFATVGVLSCFSGALLVSCSRAPAFVEESMLDPALRQNGAEADSTAMASRCAKYGSNLPECVGSNPTVVANGEGGTEAVGGGGGTTEGGGGTTEGGGGTTGGGGGTILPQNRLVAFSTPAGRTDAIPGIVTIRPLALYFALDITGSMQPNINAIKNNIVLFVDGLKSRNFLPKLGLIPFRDTYGRESAFGDVAERRFNLSDNVAAFKTYVSGLTATGGGDANEASLAATESALGEVMARENRADALKVVLTITDNPGHREGGATLARDCSIDSTVNRFNSLTVDEQKDVKLFYSTSSGSACSGYTSATGQFEAILDRILPVQSKEIRGGQIPWPLTTTALLENFTTMLTNVGATANLVCLTKSAALKVEGAEIASWNSFDYSANYANYKADNSQSLDIALQQPQLDAIQSKGGTLEATRCCFDVSAADSGDFSTCVKENTETSIVNTFVLK